MSQLASDARMLGICSGMLGIVSIIPSRCWSVVVVRTPINRCPSEQQQHDPTSTVARNGDRSEQPHTRVLTQALPLFHPHQENDHAKRFDLRAFHQRQC
jgi:hypothetical protein